MPMEELPVFRKDFTPWYDITPFCLGLVLLMDCVFLFGAVGASVTRESPDFTSHLWLPAILMALSAAVTVSVSIRLGRRFFHHLSDNENAMK
ncbi:MAG: hypothetical protein CSB33_04510 [Desulfobacterales bacterium]|nr:MAG: hypothetical protein CSB33_04510 [Desulfobacterales bacterium]